VNSTLYETPCTTRCKPAVTHTSISGTVALQNKIQINSETHWASYSFYEVSSGVFSDRRLKTNVRKDLLLIHERLQKGSHTAGVFPAVLPRMRNIKLNVHSRAPVFAYRNAPPAPYKGMQPKRRVHNRQTPQETRKQLQIKIMSERKATTGRVNWDLTLVLIYLFTYSCSVRGVLLYILWYHDAS